METYLKEYIAMWKNWNDFGGKSNLRDFWMAMLINFVVSILVSIIFGAIGLNFVSYLYSLAVLIPGIAVGIRRLHDMGKSGWNYLWFLLPFVGWIIVVYFWIQPSK